MSTSKPLAAIISPPPDSSSTLSHLVATASRILVIGLHVAYAGSYAYQARQYILQIQIDPNLQNYIYRYLGLGTSLHLGISYTLAVTSSLIAFWHAVGIFRALRASIRFRRLLLDVPDEKIIHKITSKLKSTKKIPLEGRESARNDAGSPANASCTTRWTNKIKTKAAKIHHDYFLMDGVHFEAGANFRKSIEIVTQVSVLYRMSRNMWQLLLNDLVMAAFVLNCWCTPMIRWYFRHNKDPLPSRLYRHIMTIILASVFTVVVPNTAWLYVMSLLVMDSLFDTTVTTQARFFCRHVMITEWRQVFSTRLAAVMAIIAIETLKSKVQITRREFSSVVTHGYAVASTATATPVTTSTSPSRGWKARLRSVLYAHLLVDVAWLAVGGTVLGIHITARRLPTLAPGLRCHLPMHNWLTSKYTCAVLEVSCYRGKIAGRADELNALLKSVDPLVTSAIRFTHCPSLTMPKRIQTFSDLASIEVYNSSITHWGSEAALTSSKHPFLGSLCLARVTNIASLPVGLLDLNFPACDILISATDLSSLPSDLPDLWSRTMARIVIENSNFTVFPDALLQINSLAMSFSGNDLVSVPAGALEGRMFGSLSLANNQRQAEIPPLGWVAGILDLRKTNLSSPPQWATQTMGNLNTGGGLFTLPEIGSIFGGGAPMCSSYAPDARVQLASGMVLDCSLAPFGNPTTDMYTSPSNVSRSSMRRVHI